MLPGEQAQVPGRNTARKNNPGLEHRQNNSHPGADFSSHGDIKE